MTTFSRSFDVDALAEWDNNNPGNAVRELFNRWCLPGFANDGDVRLRIGVRDRYLNFYVKGQSVAKLSLVAKEPRLEVHEAYVTGTERNRSVDRARNEQTYHTYSGMDLASADTASSVARWVSTAYTYASAEKRFVDDLVSANAGVIDLEMALPASKLPGSAPVAPRMDVVVVQEERGRPSIAFWEAKCANNPELRAKDPENPDRDRVPPVIGQVKKYVSWVSSQDRLDEVTTGYRRTADIFLRLFRHFRGKECSAPCGDLWRLLAKAEAPTIVSEPGVVVGSYWPEGYTEEIASGRMRQAADSFRQRGHRAALEAKGIFVHLVGQSDSSPTLPFLTARQVTG